MFIRIAIGLLLFLCSFVLSGKAQQPYVFGGVPEINLNFGLSDKFSVNYKIQNRHLYRVGSFGEDPANVKSYQFMDFSLIGAYKWNVNNQLAAGYLIRIRPQGILHRLIQQYSFVKQYNGFNLAHRFSADQTYAELIPNRYRFRYRITAQFPLQGSKVDAQEFYFKLNNEYLADIQGGREDLEIRIIPLLGYQFTSKNRLEFGLEYRYTGFFAAPKRHTFFLNLAWFWKQ